ncbi:lytic transglycosylase domain-containing protein [Enterobacter kobei]|uniref:Transglycosylase SLT domain-containing protein n=1 Tax=Citrobacter telavivensis TaxID=2653932 RepID=A0A6L5EF99_9ENTR|nr:MULTISPECIES: lytic transglycosylase domain-containing protein [Enterobacterales]EKY1504587.1 lytic transglycosylase domain-containing protein [Enterobacter cloacae]HDR2614755.1 lytic transglycosylase domain-containing protein [Enterobacter ludwigii]MBE0026567.1 lytic transglycosylase domain-containing protein [Citrobacter koseri]MBE0080370.1 lytic transglycosylase domain-containing protein [Citrobacter koseri]MBH0128455.1 lytic transglycosylase domain-containing protein [Enterobacter sp. S
MQGNRFSLCALILTALLCFLTSSPSRASSPLTITTFNDCFVRAGIRYQIEPLLLRAIAIGESSMDPVITNTNRDKKGRPVSTDYGLMQINSTHIPKLVRMEVIRGADDLLTRPCLNIQIGAWILARHFQVCGVTWNCLGSYNAGFRKDRHETREHYANRIWRIYSRLKGLPAVQGR